MIASSRITMEKQLLRKAPYLSRNYYFPAYLIVAGAIGSCERVELVVSLGKLTLHLMFSTVPWHIPFLLIRLTSNLINLNCLGDPFKIGLACGLHNLI